MSSGTTSSLPLPDRPYALGASAKNGSKNIINAQNVVETLWGRNERGGSEKRQARYTKAENPSRLNNVGNLPAECGNKQWRTPLLYTSVAWCWRESAVRAGDGASTYRGCCIALLLFGTHITSGITIFPLCVAFALDFFHFLHEKKAAERKRGAEKKSSSEMRKKCHHDVDLENDGRGWGWAEHKSSARGCGATTREKKGKKQRR